MTLPHFEQITEHAQIARGDCLELLPEIPSGSVDMVLTDLPYGNTSASWDVRIDCTNFARFPKRGLKETVETRTSEENMTMNTKPTSFSAVVDDENPQPMFTFTRMPGKPFHPGDGTFLYQLLRNTMIDEADKYAREMIGNPEYPDDKWSAEKKVVWNAAFHRRMDKLYKDWLMPLLHEAAGMNA